MENEMKKNITLLCLFALVMVFASGAFATQYDHSIVKAKIYAAQKVGNDAYEVKYECKSMRHAVIKAIVVDYRELINIDYMSEADFIKKYCE